MVPALCRRLLSPSCMALALVLPFAVASADDSGGWVPAPNARARLTWCGNDTAAASAIAHDTAFVEVQLAPGWKTYWRVPGDAGVPPEFDFAKSANVGKATVSYPAPHRMEDAGGVTIGYKSSVVFPIRIERRDANSPTQLVAAIAIGVCKNICIPVELTLSGECRAASLDPTLAASIETVPRAAGQARPGDPKLVGVSGSIAGDKPVISVTVDFGRAARDADIFLESPNGSYLPVPAAVAPDANGRATYSVDLSKADDVKDLIGKPVRITMVSSLGASETTWIAR